MATDYTSNSDACTNLGLSSLHTRRESLSRSFARSLLKSEPYHQCSQPNDPLWAYTRSAPQLNWNCSTAGLSISDAVPSHPWFACLVVDDEHSFLPISVVYCILVCIDIILKSKSYTQFSILLPFVQRSAEKNCKKTKHYLSLVRKSTTNKKAHMNASSKMAACWK